MSATTGPVPANMSYATKAGSIITAEGVLSYANTLFTPRVPDKAKAGTKARYQTMIVFPAGSDLKALRLAALNVAVEKIGKEKAMQLLKDKKLKLGIREDLDSAKWDTEKFTCFMNPWSNNPPGIVSNYKGPDGKPLPITNPSLIYSGVIARLSVRPFWYDQDGNRGVNWGLGNVQKIKDGTRLDGRVDAKDEFDATEDAPALDELEAMAGTGGTDDTASSSSGGQSSADELAALLG